jgi:probable rRNA maturation factor
MHFHHEEEALDSQVIAFHSEGLNFDLPNAEKIRTWIEETATTEGKFIASLNFIFCSDEYLHTINIEYLKHDTYTDVITFHYAEPDAKYIEGDIFISVERTTENAATYNVSSEKELQRVIIHGLLHLLGYEDKSVDAKNIMTNKEDEYLAKLAI